jgi:hypothetical protein
MVLKMHNLNPTEVNYMNWIKCIDQTKINQYPSHDGKWMMFFPMSDLNIRWREACLLYNSGRLIGINSMKVSTAKQNMFPGRLHGPDEGIIIFYCGPCEDKESVLRYGRNLLNNMHYSRPFLHYKSDKPHLINYANRYRQMYSINTNEHYNNNKSQMPNSYVLNSKIISSNPINNTNTINNNINKIILSNEKHDMLKKRVSIIGLPNNFSHIGNRVSNVQPLINNNVNKRLTIPNISQNNSAVRATQILNLQSLGFSQNGFSFNNDSISNVNDHNIRHDIRLRENFYDQTYNKTLISPFNSLNQFVGPKLYQNNVILSGHSNLKYY